MNVVSLIGRLTKDIELRYTPKGTVYSRFTLAVNRRVPNQQGEKEADFVHCMIWNKGAEHLANYTHKGSQIGIQGRIQTGSHDNQQGQKVYTTDVIVERFDLLESSKTSEQASGKQMNAFDDLDIPDEDLPF
ncbi:single-stranded DNA-binding protein [Carnobacteriaceae bacterium zg-ZUI78]|nr:single-stranded DNA-binding protein [Carnobacteriaceae bacterium zg-ZUI78]